MQIRIVICDDQLASREKTKIALSRIEKETDYSFAISSYESGEELLSHFDKSNQIYLLDIKMQGATGIETAVRLRELDPYAVLIFITSLPQYALDSFKVHPFSFLIKPLEYARFKQEILAAINEFTKRGGKYIALSNGTSQDIIDTQEIEYVEIFRKELVLHLTTEEKRYIMTLSEIEKQLDGCGFFKCYKSILINFMYIKKIEDSSVVMLSGDVLPVSRYRKKELLEQFSIFINNHM